MNKPTTNEDILIAKNIVSAIVHGNIEIVGAIMTEDAEGKYDTLITIMDEAIEIFERAKKAIKENTK